MTYDYYWKSYNLSAVQEIFSALWNYKLVIQLSSYTGDEGSWILTAFWHVWSTEKAPLGSFAMKFNDSHNNCSVYSNPTADINLFHLKETFFTTILRLNLWRSPVQIFGLIFCDNFSTFSCVLHLNILLWSTKYLVNAANLKYCTYRG